MVGGVVDLLVEREDLAVDVRLDHPERLRLVPRHGDRRHRDAGIAPDVLLDHLARIHAIDVVGAEHRHHVGAFVLDQVEVLVDRVGRSLEPVRTTPHLGRHRRDVVVEHRREPPRLGDVEVEAVALVLGQHDDLQVAGVGEVRQCEVDQPIGAGERHRRFGPVVGQRQEAFALPAGKNDDENSRLGCHTPPP